MIIGFCAWVFTMVLGFYLICTAQWYSYKIDRVFFHCAKPVWHIYFALLPFVIFCFGMYLSPLLAFILAFCYAGLIVYWQLKMATKLVSTSRTTRFFLILALVSVFCLMLLKKWYFLAPAMIIALILSYYLSVVAEKYLAKHYVKLAKMKLEKLKDLKIVLITASYGKTSIKNYLAGLLENNGVKSSPRSVNTLMGLVADINENLEENTRIYIAEAGARAKGDIKEITELLNPQFVIVGKIGTAHLEYFKNVETIRATKLEALSSKALKKVVAHSSTKLESKENCIIFDEKVKDVKSSLNGLTFKLNLNAKDLDIAVPNMLGEFNAENIAAAAFVASELGLNEAQIISRIAALKNTEHRLSKIENAGKIIIDDGFNGNFEGMSASYELVREHKGRKVLVTPGIMEGGKELNNKLSKIINEIFDVVIISSSLNAKELKSALKKPQVIELKNKSQLVSVLGEHTKAGDLILFSNDAPAHM